jgi:hypothetical protein
METPKYGDAQIGRLYIVCEWVETPKLGVSVQIGRLCANWASLSNF